MPSINRLVVVNPASGKVDYNNKLAAIKSKLGRQIGDVYYTEANDSVAHFADYLKSHNDFSDIVVLGGDGTLNAVVNATWPWDLPISLISNGTGNDSAKSIHKKSSFEDQLDIVMNGVLKKFDLGVCNDQYFVNGVGLGFDGAVVDELIRSGKKKRGHWAYLSVVIRLMVFYKTHQLKISLDDVDRSSELFSLNVANGTTFGGGFVTNPFAKMDDGYLDVLTISKMNLFQRFVVLQKIESGKHTDLKQVKFYKAKTVKISAPNLLGHIDGEPLNDNSYQFSILPKAIGFTVPAS